MDREREPGADSQLAERVGHQLHRFVEQHSCFDSKPLRVAALLVPTVGVIVTGLFSCHLGDLLGAAAVTGVRHAGYTYPRATGPFAYL